MYLRWSERHKYKTEILDQTEGEEAGLKSVTFSVTGRWAYGRLKSERGVHRLVRISPFDSQKRRHTSFALVEVMPEVPEDTEVEIRDDDLRIDTYRSSGAGGQHVNKTDSAIRITHLPTGIVAECQDDRSQHRNKDKAMAVLTARLRDKDLRIDTYRSSGAGGQHVNVTDSAVRITHLPTGIVTSCQNERSQMQNKARAMQVLAAKLADRQRAERRAELEQISGPTTQAAWGTQIRSYVQAPYQLVKDLRTDHETGNVQAVLDGELDPFMESWLRWRRTLQT
jgi:peptide chain release factor 2